MNSASMMTGWISMRWIIEYGNKLPPLDEKYKVPENIIQGCQSRVWLQTDYRDGKLWFQAESDAIIVKGLLALVLRVLTAERRMK